MKQNNTAEVLLSGAVIVVAAGFLAFLYWRTSGPSLSDYDLSVRMSHADGLKPGSDVQISGIKVGSISDVELTSFTPPGAKARKYSASVHFKLHDDIRIPKDSAAAAVSGGLLNPGMALAIRPGKSSDMLAPGSELQAQP